MSLVRLSSFRPTGSVLLVLLLTFAVAAGLGAVVTKNFLMATLLLALPAVASLIVHRNVRVLVFLTTAGLVLGSSTLPASASQAAFFAKFALMGTVGATALFGFDKSSRGRLSWSFSLAFLAFAGLALLSTVYSVAPWDTLQHTGSLLLLWLAAVIAIPLFVRAETDLALLLKTIALVATVSVVVGFVLTTAGLLAPSTPGRFQGIFINPNTLGYFVATILPAVVIGAIHESDPRERWLLAFMGAVIAAGLLLSGSRGGLLASTVGIAIGVSTLRRATRAIPVLVLLAVVGTSLILLREEPLRAEGEGVLEAGTGSGRIAAWPDGIRLIQERPIKGFGFAVTPIIFPEKRNPAIFRGTKFGRLHNSYLEAALDLGWPGMSFLIVLALSGVVAAWRIARIGGHWRPIGAILLAGISGGLVESIFESGLVAAGGLLAFHFWLLVAVAHSLLPQAIESRRATFVG